MTRVMVVQHLTRMAKSPLLWSLADITYSRRCSCRKPRARISDRRDLTHNMRIALCPDQNMLSLSKSTLTEIMKPEKNKHSSPTNLPGEHERSSSKEQPSTTTRCTLNCKRKNTLGRSLQHGCFKALCFVFFPPTRYMCTYTNFCQRNNC